MIRRIFWTGAVVGLICLTPFAARADAAGDLSAGRAALDAGDFDKALSLLSAAVQALPQSVDAQLTLADCYLKRGENDKALERYQTVLDLSPEHAAAKRIIESLTGARQTYAQKIALAQSFVKMGAYEQAIRVAQQAIAEAANAPQREEARLISAQAKLWSNNPAALEDAMRLIQGGTQADSGRAIAALALLTGHEPNIERAEALLKELPAMGGEAAWKPLAALSQSLLAAEDEGQAAAISGRLAGELSTVPKSPLRTYLTVRLFDRLANAARNTLSRGDLAGSLAIVWPMVGSGPTPDAAAVLKPVAFKGGWIDAKMLRGQTWVGAARLLASIGQRQAKTDGATANLLGYWLAVEALRATPDADHRNVAMFELGSELAGLSRPSAKFKPGEPLNRADEILAVQLKALRPLVLSDEQRSTWVQNAMSLVSRHEAAGNLEFGLGVFAPLPFADKGAANEFTGAAQQQWLSFLATKAVTLGAKAFQEAAATQAADANKALQKYDQIALAISGGALQLFPDDKGLQTMSQGIVDRYAQAEKWEAVIAANKALLGGASDQALQWALLRLKLRQAQSAEDKLLAGIRQLPKELPNLVKEGVQAALAQYTAQDTKANKQVLTSTLDGLIYRYASLERQDLSEAVIALVVEAKQAKLADWLLWVKANLQLREATRAVAVALAQTTDPKTLKLVPQHQAELDLLSQIVSKHADSDYFGKALARVSQIANWYQERGAFDTALGVLTAFVKAHGSLKVAEKLEYDGLTIQLLKAQRAFADRKDKTATPDKLSAEYLAVIDGVAVYLKTYPTGDYSNAALQTLLQIARTYGQVKAWPVSREVLDRFAKAAPDFRSPNQLKLWQAATYVGELDVAYGLNLLVPPTPPTAKGMSGLEGGGKLAMSLDDEERFLAEGEKLEGRTRASEDKLAATGSPKPSKPAFGGGRGGAGGGGPGGAGAGGFGFDEKNGQDGMFSAIPAIPEPATTPGAKPADPAALAAQLAISQAGKRGVQELALMKDGPMEMPKQQPDAGHGADATYSIVLPTGPVLTEAEMKRQDEAADKAYAILLELVKTAPLAETALAENARNQIAWLFGFFEGQLRADHTVVLVKRFLTDRPSDGAKIQLAYRILNDQLTWAGQRQPKDRIDKKWLDGRHTLFEAARKEMAGFVKDFAERSDWVAQARLLSVDSYDREAAMARVVSPVRSAGLLASGVDALLELFKTSPEHPAAGFFPDRMWNAAERLRELQQEELAINVLSQIPMFFPLNPRAQQAVMRIAELYATNLINPLRAVETYQEYLSVVGDNEAIRVQIFSIAQQLAAKQRYLEALHVYGVFVDSFPTDQRAPEALRSIGQTHQTNEAWDDAIKAYQRILDQFPGAALVPQVQLALAECEINLSKWSSARKRYEDFVTKYPQDGQIALAKQRIDILKQLDRYQTLLADEQVQRNKDDAQFQIGTIVNDRLNNRVKAIEEFGKVIKNYSKSSQAAAAQLEIGKALLALNKLDEARAELLKLPKNHPGSPLADDALYMIGQSYEQQAQRLAGVTLATARAEAYDLGQRGAYQQFAQTNRNQEESQSKRRDQLKQSGMKGQLDLDEAASAWRFNGGNLSIVTNSSICADQMAETASALQVANRQDKINDAYRQAVSMYTRVAGEYPLGDVTDKSLLRMAQILETELKDRKAAMETYQTIVKHFPGTPVAENAAWRVAEFYDQEAKYKEAVDAYREFIRNYPASGRVADAQFAVAEGLEQLNRWVEAMEAYETFRQKFTNHPKAQVALEQINWIRAYRK